MTERAVLLTESDTVSVGDLPERLKPIAAPVAAELPGRGEKAATRGSLRDAVAEVEKKRVIDALAESGGNQKKASEILGISRGTLLTRLDTFGIPPPRKE